MEVRSDRTPQPASDFVHVICGRQRFRNDPAISQGLCGILVEKGVLVGVIERLDLEVDIEIGPVKMNSIDQLDVDNAFDRSVLEPGIVGVRQKILPPEHKQPDAVRRDI